MESIKTMKNHTIRSGDTLAEAEQKMRPDGKSRHRNADFQQKGVLL